MPMPSTAIRRAALEEAATWHEREIEKLDQQIDENNTYARRSGVDVSEANISCRTCINHHRSAAAAIRALANGPAGESGKPTGAIENLRTVQRQLDQDGVEVGVSRQALDELLAFIGANDGEG